MLSQNPRNDREGLVLIGAFSSFIREDRCVPYR
jgi:hypothetical protein